jgi:hypothetical protein
VEGTSAIKSLKAMGRGGRLLANTATEIADGIIVNTYFNTMAGTDYSGKQMILDVGLDSLGGTIGSFRKELNYIK